MLATELLMVVELLLDGLSVEMLADELSELLWMKLRLESLLKMTFPEVNI
jgi:hypothetical protein